MQDELKSFFEQAHQSLLTKPKYLEYFTQRGVTLEQIKKYQFGYLPNVKLSQENFNAWSKNGKLLENRLIFPLKNSQGKYKGLGSRLVFAEKGQYQYFYFDSIEATFFGIENLKKVYETEICYLTEGIFDHLVLEQVFGNCLCGLTANVSSKQIAFLKRYVKTLIIAFDIDQTGNDKTNFLVNEVAGLTVYRIDKYLTTKQKNVKDLNNLYKELGFEKFKHFVEQQNNLFVT